MIERPRASYGSQHSGCRPSLASRVLHVAYSGEPPTHELSLVKPPTPCFTYSCDEDALLEPPKPQNN
eukprot:2359273-Amphidinium_carterae.1